MRGGYWKVGRLVLLIGAVAVVGYSVGFGRVWLVQPRRVAVGSSVRASVVHAPVDQGNAALPTRELGTVQEKAIPSDVPPGRSPAETKESQPAGGGVTQVTPKEDQATSEKTATEDGSSFSPSQNQKLQEVQALSAEFGYSQSDAFRSIEKARSGRIFDKGKDYRNTQGIVRLWGEGKWEDALEIGQMRLLKDPNDLAGLIIQAGYARETGDIDAYLDTAKTLLQVLTVSDTPCIKEIKPSLVRELPHCMMELRLKGPETLQFWREPTNRLPNHPFIYEFCLKACESDGLF